MICRFSWIYLIVLILHCSPTVKQLSRSLVAAKVGNNRILIIPLFSFYLISLFGIIAYENEFDEQLKAFPNELAQINCLCISSNFSNDVYFSFGFYIHSRKMSSLKTKQLYLAISLDKWVNSSEVHTLPAGLWGLAKTMSLMLLDLNKFSNLSKSTQNSIWPS